MATVNTRDQIIRTLRTHGPQTAADLCALLGVGASAVRQHLERLVAQGWVELAGLRRGRGRPQHLYALTPQADLLFPQHYDGLILDLLAAMERLADGKQVLKRLLAARRELWNERYGPRLAGQPLEQRLAQLTQVLNEQGGLASYTAQPDGTYLLTNHHCSIAAVVARYPQFCLDEQDWIAEALQSPTEVLQSRAAGDTFCLFRIPPHPPHSPVQKGE